MTSTPAPNEATVPTFAERVDEIADAEQGDGWLCACDDAGRFLALCGELVESLAAFLESLSTSVVVRSGNKRLFAEREATMATAVDGPIVEVCAGRGELAGALRSAGVEVVATDADPPAGSGVERASADEALRRYRPAVVLGCFCPVDETVLGFASVRHYVVLGARIGGLFGSVGLRESAQWAVEPLEEVTRWLLTRHDVWVGPTRRILRHGEAWHFHRR